MRAWGAAWRAVVCVCALVVSCAPGLAGRLARADLERAFPPPFSLGEKDDALPVWPVFKQNATENELVAYLFESVDLAPIPGFSGTPIDLLVALTPEGSFLDVKVVHNHEPVFVDGLGPEPLFDFVKQYRGLSLKQTIKVGPPAGGVVREGPVAVVDGVAKATASVRILNETLMAAGLAVARAKLGFAEARDPARASRLKPDAFEKLDWPALVARGYVRHHRLTNREAEAAFAGTPGAGLDAAALADPQGGFIDLSIAELDAPMVGRNLLGDAAFARLLADLDGRHALLVVSQGRYSFKGEDFVEGAAPTRLTLEQAGAPVELRDFAWRQPIPAAPPGDLSVFVIKPQTGWDPGATSTLSVLATREKGQILPEKITRAFGFAYATPADLLIAPPPPETQGPLKLWRERARDTAVIALALAALAAGLALQKPLTRDARRFVWLRRAYLIFTLLFIGYVAQAQLSVVTLIGLVRAARGEGALTFLLYDPPSLLLWGFVAVTLVIWGRGPFCGWLCPFGAMQELAADFGRRLGARPLRVSDRWDARLKGLKYVALAGVLGAAAIPNGPAESVAEIEPFKTAITLDFVRAWPFVLYALGLVVGGAFVFKFFCRYLCPLGAAFALIGRLRRWNWLERRADCGSPCQLCKSKCRYNAIARSGAIVYHECFQCMDCVVIHNDARQCVPLVLAARGLTRPLARRAAE